SSFLSFNPTSSPEIYTFPTRRSSDLTRGSSGLSNFCPYRSRRSATPSRRGRPPAPDVGPWSPARGSESTIAGRSLPGAILLPGRSEEHTSELQSLTNLVCRLLLEKKH